jgi:hypothetical protein
VTVPQSVTRHNIPFACNPGAFFVFIPADVSDASRRRQKLRKIYKTRKTNKKIRRHNRRSFFPRQLRNEAPYRPEKKFHPPQSPTTEVELFIFIHVYKG